LNSFTWNGPTMDLHSFINAGPCSDPPALGQEHDPQGETAPSDTIYTLLVYIPPRPPPSYLPKFLFRDATPVSPNVAIRSTRDKANYDCFERLDLVDMKAKLFKIKARLFPCELRCKHLYKTNEKKCEHGCYVLEKSGNLRRWTCKRFDCEGHVYCGNVKEARGNEEGVVCFGRKGERMVCADT
jgi:hypothetical protein